MSAPVVQWICKELSRLLGMEATEDIAKYILAIETRRDLEEYMCELLDSSIPKNRKFINQLLDKWRPPARNVLIPDNVQVYQKPEEDDEYITGPAKSKSKKKEKKTNNPEGKAQIPLMQHSTADTAQNGVPVKPSALETHQPGTDSRKKQKFVPLFSEEGEARTVAKLPGRHACECQASKHALVNNCTRCGRVVCEQEGSGPCVFCGSLVCTKAEQEVLARGSKRSEKLRQQLMQKGGSEAPTIKDEDSLTNSSSRMQMGLQEAERHKNKLIDYDKTSAKRTQVIDDQSDYFATDSNRWLSKKEREALRKREAELHGKRHASRKDRKVTLDFAGRRVIEDDEVVDMYNVNDSVIQDVHYGAPSRQSQGPNFTEEDFGELVNPTISQPPPVFLESQLEQLSLGQKKSSNIANQGDEKKKNLRIQDRELKEMSDEGMCMSMHQPWASLLVKGIKIHEGRSWYTSHRGRLWIAATAKRLPPQEIADIEHDHRITCKDANVEFPNEYPVACLLGCVDVVDCLAQDEYRIKFPEGESGSPYVFICENPRELVVKFPIKGKHKIYKLESHIHQGARKGLRRGQTGNE